MDELLEKSMDELKAYISAMGEKPFRASQLYQYLVKGVPFEEMTTLPLSLRSELAKKALPLSLKIHAAYPSKIDGTVKLLYDLPDGNLIEGVLMRYHYGYTLCVSTQVGCKMGCLFCASTLGGCVRSLSASEMLSQVVCANRYLGDKGRVGHVVLMGSGEPFDNYNNVIRFLNEVRREDGLSVGLRNVSLSTCGLVPEMIRFADENLPVTLSVSLHAPNDEIRRQIMPIAKTYAISQVIEACRLYIKKTGRRVIFEYALIDGINADTLHAYQLSNLLRNMQCHVNVIPLNSVPERGLRGVSEKQVSAFLKALEEKHISATRRREMGDDIEGACGQLRRHTMEGNT